MQLPKRRSQSLRIDEENMDGDFVTAEGLERMKKTLRDLEDTQRPRAVEDVSTSVIKGDLSENAEYQEARSRLSRIQSRVFSLQERIKRAIVIEQTPGQQGNIQLGSTVMVRVHKQEREYQIVGPQESNPSRGKISHVSPLGSALLGHRVGEIVMIGENQLRYEILRVS